MSKNIPPISLSWNEGAFFDVWTIVHTLSGFVLGLGAGVLSLEESVALWVVLALLVLWEMGEIFMKIHELPINRVIDVVVGMVGFFAAWAIVETILPQELFIVFAASVTILVILNFFGWRAYRQRKG